MLERLIASARAGGKGNVKFRAKIDPLTEVRNTLSEATKIVEENFGLNDKSELKESHVVLIQEVRRQPYGLKYWVEKSSPRLTSQPILNQ
jgi:hypothetical protein